MDELVDLEDDLGTRKDTSIEEAIKHKVDNNLGGSSSKALPCPDPLATGLGDLVPETTLLE